MAQEQSKWTLSREDRQWAKKHTLISLGSIVFMVVFGLLVHYEHIRLHPSVVTEGKLETLLPRIEFTLRYQSLQLLWLMFNVFAVIHRRIKHISINPLDSNIEVNIQANKNTLTNSLESIFISIVSQLIFITFAEAKTVLKFIPFFNILMLISRITFFAGYPFYRGFGVQSTLVPNTFLVCYNAIKLVSFLFS